MSTAVLEINDHAMGLYNHNGLMISSPGYVLAHGKQPLFGQHAIEQSRLHPVSINNEFWHRLGMTPLSRPLAHFRHNADIAHGHLLHLAQETGFDGEVVISVPASFSREQLAVLSGVLQHSPFKARAIMDAALVAADQLPDNRQLVYVDVQLHQLSFTRLLNSAGHVRRDAFAVVPGAGSIAFGNTIVQVVTDAFIAQSRFNPQHSAAWEQQLYNELPAWLQQFHDGQQEILVQISTDKNTVQARVGISEILQVLEPAFQKISQHFAQFVTPGTDGNTQLPVLLSGRAALIPGLSFCLKALPLLLSAEQRAEFCLRALSASSVAASATAGSGVSYISSVARARPESVTAPAEVSPSLVPTHILYQSQAWPLPLSASLDGDNMLVFSSGPARAENEVFSIAADGAAAVLHSARADLRVGSEAPSANILAGNKQLVAGDLIRVPGINADILCIKVHE